MNSGREKSQCCGGEGAMYTERGEREERRREREQQIEFTHKKNTSLKPLTEESRGSDHCKFSQTVELKI